MSSDDNSSHMESENEATPGKKRTRNPEKWKVNKRKLARQRGESYISTSGKFIEAKRPGPACT